MDGDEKQKPEENIDSETDDKDQKTDDNEQKSDEIISDEEDDLTKDEVLEQVLKSFKRYYNIKRTNVLPPFVAEAEFITHDEGYFLVKRAKIYESDSKEYVFFSEEENLSLKRLNELDKIAWEEGLKRADPAKNHKSTDVVLVIIADDIDPDASTAIKKLYHYKSYMFTLRGWSEYRLIAFELSTGQVVFNRQGRTLEKLFSTI